MEWLSVETGIVYFDISHDSFYFRSCRINVRLGTNTRKDVRREKLECMVTQSK
jgi:hypothetical protein